jgi:hypothetical protein
LLAKELLLSYAPSKKRLRSKSIKEPFGCRYS